MEANSPEDACRVVVATKEDFDLTQVNRVQTGTEEDRRKGAFLLTEATVGMD